MRKRIGIFGGAFDPPHKGHVEICRYLLKNNDVDEIWVVPCFKHPFNKEMSTFSDRITMCRFAFAGFQGKVAVSDVESRIGEVSYTINTVEYLLGHEADKKFFLILGSDTAKDAVSWMDSARLRSMIQFITVPRGPASPIPDISSTEVRDNIKMGRSFIDLVPKEVAIYIVTHGLYS